MRDILDSWFRLQNEWDEELFLSIHIDHRRTVPRTPDGYNFYKSCCMETFTNLITIGLYDDVLLREIVSDCLGSMNMRKLRVIVKNTGIKDDQLAYLLSTHQNLYLVENYKTVFEGDVWERVVIREPTLSQMCVFPRYSLRLLSLCTDPTLLDVICLIVPPTRDVLSTLGCRTPVSWAYRVGVTTDIFITCVRYGVSLEVLYAITIRGVPITAEETEEFMRSYPLPSSTKEKVLLYCLATIEMSEYDFLSTYMPDSKRHKHAERLATNHYPMCGETFTNTCTLYGTPTEDCHSIYMVITGKEGETRYLLDVREIVEIVNGGTYTHPYTRDILSSSIVVERYNRLLEENIPISLDVRGVPCRELPSIEMRVAEMMEKNDLSLYTREVANITCTCGFGTFLALSTYPDIVRLYDGGLSSTILSIYPEISSMAKACI